MPGSNCRALRLRSALGKRKWGPRKVEEIGEGEQESAQKAGGSDGRAERTLFRRARQGAADRCANVLPSDHSQLTVLSS